MPVSISHAEESASAASVPKSMLCCRWQASVDGQIRRLTVATYGKLWSQATFMLCCRWQAGVDGHFRRLAVATFGKLWSQATFGCLSSCSEMPSRKPPLWCL